MRVDMTFSQILDQMADMDHYCWTLFVYEGSRDKKLIGSYIKQAKDVNKEESVRRLEAILEKFRNQGRTFALTMKSAQSVSSEKAIIGPLNFTLDGEATEPNLGNIAPPQAFNPAEQFSQMLQGLGSVVPAGLNQMQMQLIREQGQLDTAKAMLERDRREFEQKQKEWKEATKELEEKWESRAELGKEGFGRALESLVTTLVKSGPKGLAGAQAAPEEEEEELDEREQIIEDLAQFLNVNVQSLPIMAQLADRMKQWVEKISERSQEQEPSKVSNG